MGVIDTITGYLDDFKKKITGVTENSTPSPLSSSNATSIQGGGRRRRMHGKTKRMSNKKRKSTKRVRFSKKNKVYTYKRK